jgi:hypothetical protein
VEPLVLRSGEDDEVGGVVVERIAVRVMHDLVRVELSAFAHFKDVTVLGDLLAVDPDEAIAAFEPASASSASNNSTVVAAPPRSLDAARRRARDPPSPTGAGL